MNWRYKILKRIWNPVVGLPLPWALYMYVTRKIFFSKTTWPIKLKFYMTHLYEAGTNLIINKPGHMTKMEAMPIYGKKPFKNLLRRNC